MSFANVEYEISDYFRSVPIERRGGVGVYEDDQACMLGEQSGVEALPLKSRIWAALGIAFAWLCSTFSNLLHRGAAALSIAPVEAKKLSDEERQLLDATHECEDFLRSVQDGQIEGSDVVLAASLEAKCKELGVHISNAQGKNLDGAIDTAHNLAVEMVLEMEDLRRH